MRHLSVVSRETMQKLLDLAMRAGYQKAKKKEEHSAKLTEELFRQQISETDDGGQRGSEFMTHVHKEFTLSCGGSLGLRSKLSCDRRRAYSRGDISFKIFNEIVFFKPQS